jgi:hypothetical protein
MTRPSRLPLALAGVGTLLVCAAACSSSPGPNPDPSSSASQLQLRLADAPALLTQCMLSRGTLKPSDSVLSGQSAWLHGTKVVITSSSSTKFSAWFAGNGAIKVSGKTLSDWVQSAAANDKLPTAVCGNGTSAAAMQKQVFANDPGAGNPWGT